MVRETFSADRIRKAAEQSARTAVLCALAAGVISSCARERQPDRFQLLPRDLSLQPLTPASAPNLEFIGARSFTPDQLREPLAEQLREIDERGLTRPRADDTAYYLAVFYRKAGFADVEVNWEIRGTRLVLRVDEGRKTILGRVRFSGNRSITEATLYEYMIGATRERMLAKPSDFPFVKGDVETGVARVRGLYEAEGFVDAEVDDPVITFSGDRTRADVLVKIREGRRYTFADPTFSGNTLFPRADLIKALGEPLREPYTTQRVNTMERNLLFFFQSRGYFKAEVAVIADPKRAAGGRVPVSFTVTPHQLFRFNGITVRGTDRLRPSFLPKRFAKLQGQIYDPAKLDETYREMLRTNLFRNLRITPVPQKDDTIRLDLTVEEAKAKELGFSIGFGTYEGLTLGFRLGDRNFRGRGRPLTFNSEVSQRALRGELLYVDPWWFESEYGLRARLYAQTRDEEGYSKQEFGIRGDLTRKITKNIELGVFLQIEHVGITEAFVEPEFLGTTSYQIATVGLTQSYDFRDHPINPSRGVIINTTVDADAIAGDVAFGRATARISYYVPLSKRVSLALGARGGLIYPLTEVPIDERYFLGGATTVRSFAERELGPMDRHGYPIGGQAFTIFNAEVTFPLVSALQGAAFVDAGNLVGEFAQAGVQDMRYAVGLGLRYKLPIGPLRLDYGLNPNPREDEKIGAFHFSFGFAF